MAVALAALVTFQANAQAGGAESADASTGVADLVALEKARVLPQAEAYLDEAPVTVTASHSERSAGGPHDFYSEGDYWWPDPDLSLIHI